MADDKSVIRLKLSPELRRRFRVDAFNRGTTMQAILEGFVIGLVGGAGKVVVESGAALPKEQPKKAVELVKEPQKSRVCGRCARSTNEWKLIDGLAVCPRHW